MCRTFYLLADVAAFRRGYLTLQFYSVVVCALRGLLHDHKSSVEKLQNRDYDMAFREKFLETRIPEVYRYVTSGNLSFLREFFNTILFSYTSRISSLLQLPNRRVKYIENGSLSFREV